MANHEQSIANTTSDIQSAKQEETMSRLAELLQGLLKIKGVNEAIAAVESGDKSFRWSGVACNERVENRKIETGTPFFTASITKLFIAASVLKLHEQNLLSLEHPAAEFLPLGLIDGLHRMKNGADHSAQITVRHLLSHTSGLPDYLEIKIKGKKTLFDIILEEGDRAYTVLDFMQIVRNAGVSFFPPQSQDQPVKKARYADTNYQLLMAMVEEVTKKPLDLVFKDMFYSPLGLRNTFHPGSQPLEAHGPEPLKVRGGEKFLDLPLALHSFRDLYSTTSDLIVFLSAVNSGNVFLKADTADLMKSNWNRFGFHISPVAPGWPIEYGLGMMRLDLPRIVTRFKAVPAVIGHTGACGSWLFYCPELDFYLTGTVNQLLAAAAPFRFVPQVLNVLKNYRG